MTENIDLNKIDTSGPERRNKEKKYKYNIFTIFSEVQMSADTIPKTTELLERKKKGWDDHSNRYTHHNQIVEKNLIEGSEEKLEN